MATANAQNVSGTGQGDGGFFSRITDFLGNASNVTREVGNLWNNVSPVWSSAPPESGSASEPTYQAPPNPVTTASTQSNPNSIMPILLIGGAVVLLLFLK